MTSKLETAVTPSRLLRGMVRMAIVSLLVLPVACGDEGGADDSASRKAEAAKPAPAPVKKQSTRPETPADMPNGLVLALSAFPEGSSDPLPAELEFIVRKGGEWIVTRMTDEDSNVFHKAMAYETPQGETKLLTAAGEKALLKLWTKGESGFTAEVLWEKDFGGCLLYTSPSPRDS